MDHLIRYCMECRRYTMEEKCSLCGGGVPPRHPARYSPEDRYGEYRRRLKREMQAS